MRRGRASAPTGSRAWTGPGTGSAATTGAATYVTRAGVGGGPRPRHAYGCPVGGRGDAVRAVRGKVVGVPSVTAADSFFELGGDSILSIQLIGRARAAGLTFTTGEVFENPTVSALARVARRRGRQVPAAAEPDTGPFPATPIIKWLRSLGAHAERRLPPVGGGPGAAGRGRNPTVRDTRSAARPAFRAPAPHPRRQQRGGPGPPARRRRGRSPPDGAHPGDGTRRSGPDATV